MHRRFEPVIVVLGIVMAATVRAASVPLEAFGNLPSLEDLALSPDGTELAFVKTRGETRLLTVVSLAERKSLFAIELGQIKLRHVQWADDRHLWVLESVTAAPMQLLGPAREWSTVAIVDVGTHKVRNALDGNVRGLSSMLNATFGMPSIRVVGEDTFLYVGAVGMPGGNGGTTIGGTLSPALIRVNLTNGSAALMATGDTESRGWVVDETGNVVAEQRYNSATQRWRLVLHRKGQDKQEATGHESIDVPTIAGIAPDGGSVWVRTIEDEEPLWKTMNFADGSWGEVSADARDLDTVFTDSRTGRVVGGLRFSPAGGYWFVDNHRQQVWAAVRRAFPAARVQLVSASDDFNRLVVKVEQARAVPTFMFVDMNTGHAEAMGKLYEHIDRAAEVRPMEYKAQDGLTIHAFVILPPDRPESKLPLIVLPHGGPAVRDTAGFDWWAQALAAQGYVVLQPNYRGSALGHQFLAAGFGQWGRKMQTDLSDGVAKLVADGLVDPKRVCIVGASYGGYAALAGVSIQSGIYRCAVSVAGISDLPRFLTWHGGVSGRDSQADRYFDRFLGVSSADDPALLAISPMSHIDNISAPVLLVHGRNDTVVPFEQSGRLAESMTKAGKKVELVELKEEDHWLSHGATRLQMLESVVGFLRANNPPDL